ncbi:MAG: hypothetical protein H6728_08915 [Myxococcales bacterium]|nr:hypothetical protein [Myxococcales bacterium]
MRTNKTMLHWIHTYTNSPLCQRKRSTQKARWLVFLGWLFLWTSPAHANPCPPPASLEPDRCGEKQPEQLEKDLREGVKLYQKGEFSSAIEAFEKARQNNPSRPLLRYYLARAYLQMAERYGSQGDKQQQRLYYQRALKEDPRLIENPKFVAHYKKLQTQNDLGKTITPQLKPRKKRVWNLGLGLSAGIEGLGGIQVSLLLWGLLNPIVTFAPGSPSLDISFRIIPLRSFAWSPYIGGGIMMPIRSWTGALSSIFPEPVMHFDLGVHFISELGFSFTAGLSFVYNFDPQTSLPFLPLPSLNFFWYF